MTILFICDEYPPGKNGGIGTAVQSLARELVAQGHRVIVAGLYAYRYGQKDEEIDQGVEVFRLRYGPKLPVSNENRLYNALEKLPSFIKSRLNGKKAFYKFISFINRLIETEKIDLIEIADYNNFCTHMGFVVEWPAFKAPLVLKCHGSHTYICRELGLTPNPILEKTDQRLYQRADAITSVSQYTAALSQQLFHVSKEIRVVYNGLNIPAPVETKRDPQTVIFSGSIAANKGIFSLMKAWNLVHEAFSGAQLLVFGKGSTQAAMSLLTASVKNSVQFKGHVPKAVLMAALQKATLAAFPSYSETFGLGVVEAMSTGCPVISTKRSSGPEIVTDGLSGLLVDPDNTEEIADKIKLLLQDATLRQKLGDAGFLEARSRFNIQQVAANHTVYYKQVISDFLRA